MFESVSYARPTNFICESNEDLSAAGLKAVRKKNIEWQEKWGHNSGFDLHTCGPLKELAKFYKRTGRPGEEAAQQRLDKLHEQIAYPLALRH
jgi:hypothetical protein